MKRHTAALILPYYGKFPNYFPLWLKSAGANPEFTFMIFTDIDMSGYNIPPNVQVYAMTLEEIRLRASLHLTFDPVLKTPYKLCDYKPMFGLIFQDWLDGYDFWGYCDCDIIWGDLSKFITDDILDRYDKLYQLGHLQLFRNNGDINRFILHKLPGWNISYVDAYHTDKQLGGFAEYGLPENLFKEFVGGGRQYIGRGFADIYTFTKEFRQWGREKAIPAFRWKDGKVIGLAFGGNLGLNMEYLYLHLQKRAMKFTPGLENENSFMVIPNEFVKDHELTQEEIQVLLTPDPEFERAQRAKYPTFGLPPKPTFIRRIKKLIKRLVKRALNNDVDKIIDLKKRWNRLRGRTLRRML